MNQSNPINPVSQQQVIFHITQRDRWAQANTTGSYTAESLETEGFIHCSTAVQVVNTANKYYRGQQGLLLLVIAPDMLEPELIYENPAYTTEAWFPHIYGPLNVDAVSATVEIEADVDGLFGHLQPILDSYSHTDGTNSA